jgi:nudix motif 8
MIRRFASSSTTTADVLFSAASRDRFIDRCKQFAATKSNHPKITDRSYAVLVPLVRMPDGSAGILFTHRSNELSEHRGQLSFPGGRVELNDASIESAALRESHEEVGIVPDRVCIWHRLRPALTRTLRHTVVPVVGIVDMRIDELRADRREVQAVFARSIDELCAPGAIAHTQFRADSKTQWLAAGGFCLPVFFTGDGQRIWGLTGIILHQTLLMLVPELYKSTLNYVTL